MNHATKRLAIYAVLMVTALVLTGCDKSAPAENVSPLAAPKISLGIQSSPAMAVPMVAEELGLFDKEGVDVEIKEFSAGKFALQAMLGGSVDLAVAGEVPVGLAVMQGNDLRVFAQVVRKTTNEVRVVARSDSGITEPKAYFSARKRKLATSLGGGPEFFTWSYLKHLGIKPDEIEILGQKPEDMPAALASGSVDGIAIFDPFAFIAEKQMGRAAVTFPDVGVYSELYVLAATPGTSNARSVQIQAIVRALVKAAESIRENPKRAQEIVRKYTHLDGAVVEGVWGSFDFSPALTPQLLEYWQRQVGWARETGKLDAKATDPDFRKIIDDRALRAASPANVTY